MGGLLEGWVDFEGWVGCWEDGWVVGRMGGLLGGWVGCWKDGWVVGRMDGWVVGRMGKLMGGLLILIDRWMNELVGGKTGNWATE